MWAELWCAIGLAAALLVVPGAVALSALGVRPAPAIASAPLLTTAVYGIAAVALDLLGIPASTPLVVAPALIAALALLAVRIRRRPPRRIGIVARRELATLALYVALGLAVTSAVLIANLDGADSFLQAWDNVAHFNTIRAMANSHVWSTLRTTGYTGGFISLAPFPSEPHFYPAAWHLMAVMLVDALNVPVTLAANAVNAVACAVVYPVGTWLLLSRVFARRASVVPFGAVTCLAFSSFPWNLIPRWTLYPLLFSLAMLPAVIAAFMRLAAAVMPLRRRVVAGATFVVGCVSLALAQPSAVFSAGVFLAPWCAWRVFAWRRTRGSSPARAAAWAAGFLALVAVLWVAVALAPFMRSVVSYYWPPICSLQDAVDYVLNLTFCDHTERTLLCLLVAVGVVRALALRRARWAVAPFAFCAVAFVVAAAGEDTPIKHLLTGFWYTDPYRLAAMAVIFCAPLAALGLATPVQLARRALASRAPAAARALAPALCALAAFGLYAPALLAAWDLPQLWNNDDFAVISWELAHKNDGDARNGYDARKQAFVERVLDLVGPDELVLNVPYDGSVYAYGVSGPNVYYRSMDGYGEASATSAHDEDAKSSETDASVALRTGLSQLLDGTHQRTIDALEESGIRYLLILDRDDEAMKGAFYPYVSWRWRGILSVGDETPGFEVVLAEGDMRLYRITALG